MKTHSKEGTFFERGDLIERRALNRIITESSMALDAMNDLPLDLPVVDTIHPQSSKFVMGVKFKAAGDSKRNHSPGMA